MSMIIPWSKYALIVEIVTLVNEKGEGLGKTILQKLIFLLQEVYRVPCGYDFAMYSYGPFDSQLMGDLDFVSYWKGVSITPTPCSGYMIEPGSQGDSVRAKGSDFLDNDETQAKIRELIATYGSCTARDLELIATIVYVAQDLEEDGIKPEKEKVCEIVNQIKPKFKTPDIRKAIDELLLKNHIEVE